MHQRRDDSLRRLGPRTGVNPLQFLGFKSKTGVMYSPAEFLALIQRERSRSDRNSHGFSVVVFEYSGTALGKVAAEALLRVLRTRCRFTDEVGWLGEGKLAVMLPDTDAEGARVFADCVRYALVDSGPLPICNVHTYTPSNPDFVTRRNDRQLCFSQIVASLPPSLFEDAGRGDTAYAPRP